MFSVFADSYFTKLEVSQVSHKRVLQDITSSVMENSSSHPSPASSVSSEDTVEVIAGNKRKRQDDDENEPNKRRSEEPLFKIVHKLVDETETDIDEKINNKENEEKKTDDTETDVKEDEKEVIESKDDKEEDVEVGVTAVVDEVGKVTIEGSIHSIWVIIIATVEVKIKQISSSLSIIFLPSLLRLITSDHLSNILNN